MTSSSRGCRLYTTLKVFTSPRPAAERCERCRQHQHSQHCPPQSKQGQARDEPTRGAWLRGWDRCSLGELSQHAHSRTGCPVTTWMGMAIRRGTHREWTGHPPHTSRHPAHSVEARSREGRTHARNKLRGRGGWLCGDKPCTWPNRLWPPRLSNAHRQTHHHKWMKPCQNGGPIA